MSYRTLNHNTEYEIEVNYPHRIRRIGGSRFIKESSRKDGYVKVYINRKYYYKHRIIAENFIPNDDPLNKTCVDHINHIRSDNHISNLRWVSVEENNKNKVGYNDILYQYLEYDEAPEDLIEVSDYNGFNFEDYYYSPSENQFYFDNGIKYRVLHTRNSGYGYALVTMNSVNDIAVSVYYNKFKRLYNIQ